MSLDRSRLTKEERDELRTALEHRRAVLVEEETRGATERIRRNAIWRLYVVETLLAELG